jgi:hypothetical protein
MRAEASVRHLDRLAETAQAYPAAPVTTSGFVFERGVKILF